MKRRAIKYIFILVLFLAISKTGFSQSITASIPEKFTSKYSDYEILGKNSFGTILHFFNEDINHQLVVYNESLRPINKAAINLQDRNASLEEIVVLPEHIALFYSQLIEGMNYLKVKKLNSNLDITVNALTLDSVKRDGIEQTQPYYIKTSPDNSQFLCFNLQGSRAERLRINYVIYNSQFQLLKKSTLIFENNNGVDLKASRIANNGNAVFLIAHNSRRPIDDKYAIENFNLVTINHLDYKPITRVIESKDLMYKLPALDIAIDGNKIFLSACYQDINDPKILGIMNGMFSFNAEIEGFVSKIPLTEEDISQFKSFEFRNWWEKASIIRPKNIIPRSDGGFILINESEYRYTKVVRSPSSNSFNTYPYYNQDQYIRYYDQNHYYDIIAYSIDPNGKIDWKTNLSKVQETESDGGIFSSYLLFESNNMLKFLFNEDIYNNGNFMEYNLNANGNFKRISLLNSEKKELQLIPQKGKQIDANTLIIPSERKKYLQLVMIKY